jgi:hypothetical protein
MIDLGFTKCIKINTDHVSYGYIIQMRHTGFCKVGTSMNIGKRIYQHLRYSPFGSGSVRVLFLCVFKCNSDALRWEFDCKTSAVKEGIGIDGDWIERVGDWICDARHKSTGIWLRECSDFVLGESICSIMETVPEKKTTQYALLFEG